MIRSEARRRELTPCDRRNDAHLVGCGDRRIEIFEVADVFVVHIDVDEPAKFLAIEESFAERGILRAEVAEELADGGTGSLDAIVTAGVGRIGVGIRMTGMLVSSLMFSGKIGRRGP